MTDQRKDMSNAVTLYHTDKVQARIEQIGKILEEHRAVDTSGKPVKAGDEEQVTLFLLTIGDLIVQHILEDHLELRMYDHVNKRWTRFDPLNLRCEQ